LRGILTGYDDSIVPVDGEFENDGDAPSQSKYSKSIPNARPESAIRKSSGKVYDQTESHGALDPLSTEPDNDHEKVVSSPPESTSAFPDPELSLLGNAFHVFIWLNLSCSNLKSVQKDLSKGEKSPSRKQKQEISDELPQEGGDIRLMANENHMKGHLGEMDHFLTRMTNLNLRLNYQGCTNRSRQDTYEMLVKEKQELNESSKTDLKRRKNYENKVDLLNAANLMFQFFLPSKIDGPTVGKYWGALFQLIAVSIRIFLDPFKF
jgi:hypothetical protein